MSALPRASEAELLTLIIGTCYVLAAAAFGVWLGVFLVRSYRLKRAAEAARAEEELTGLVLDQLAGYNPQPAGGAWLALPPWKRQILLRVLQNLIDQTKGRDRAQLVRTLEAAGFRKGAFDTLAHGTPEQRRAACELLGKFEDAGSHAALARALDDADAAVRITAARALLHADRIDSLQRLLGQLRFSHEDPPLLLSEMLGHLPARLEPEATSLLQDPSLPPEWLRVFAIALGRRQVFAAFDGIAGLRRSPSPRVRAAAWVALRELGDPRAGDLVHEGLTDESPDVRQAAAECAGKLGGPEIVPLLQALLGDAEWWVQFHAAQALIELGAGGRQIVATAVTGLTPESAAWQAWNEHGRTSHGF